MGIDLQDTIVAISTPPGENGIGIVRLSGPSAIKIADLAFFSKNGKGPSQFRSHTVHYGYIMDKCKRIDEVLLTVMRAPKTYTRQDMVEINCHGGIIVLRKTLALMIALGARMAEAGEFTKRAFLNGRIDLTQAEAVLDVITSRTEDSLRLAERQLDGEISSHIRRLRSYLLDIVAEMEADINFPDEKIEISKTERLRELLLRVKRALSNLLESSKKGLILKQGITVVICGRQNVGKSTLMNSFLKYNRVIISPIPGTTRDIIEELIDIKGIPLRMVDTAGIIQAEDEITKESIEMAYRFINAADLILLVLDSSDKLTKQDMDVIDKVKDKKVLVVVNKIDLPERLQIDQIKNHLHDKRVIKVSAKEKTGLEELKTAIYDMFWSGKISSENIMLSNFRHIEAVRKASNFIKDALKVIGDEAEWELASFDIKKAVEELGTITGEVFRDDLLDKIFSKFCIGK